MEEVSLESRQVRRQDRMIEGIQGEVGMVDRETKLTSNLLGMVQTALLSLRGR